MKSIILKNNLVALEYYLSENYKMEIENEEEVISKIIGMFM